jgi:hypothetical protein
LIFRTTQAGHGDDRRRPGEVERARELRDFVVSFRDGKITIDEFAREPQSMRCLCRCNVLERFVGLRQQL